MRAQIIRTIAVKELREALRDRKTLLLTLLLPMLLYPGLMLLVTQVAVSQMAELQSVDSRVVITGELDSPAALAIAEASGVSAEFVVDALPDPLARDADAVVRITEGSGGQWLAELQYRSVIEESMQAAERVRGALEVFNLVESHARIEAAGLPSSTLEPATLSSADLSPVQQRGGHVLGSILPMLVLMTVMMGALYPAIDVTAGEKERGTIQTLFTAPVTAPEVVAGKYLAVVGLGMVTGAANLGSIALVFSHNVLLASEMTSELDFSISLGVLLGLAVAIVFVAALVSAVLMCAAVLARSFKDAQTWVTPVYLLCMVPGMVAQMPGFELTQSTALIPIAGPVLLMRSMLLNGVDAGELLMVGAGSVAHVALALTLATRLFDAEDVITGGRASWAVLGGGRRLSPVPTSSEAMAWYAVGFLLLYYGGSTLQKWSPQVGLVATLWGLLLVPTLVVAWRQKVSWRATFSLRPAHPAAWLAAVLLGCSAFVVVGTINELVQTWVLRPSPELMEQMARDMARFFPVPETALDWALLLFVGAISPAVCEELLFRGYVLSGLRQSMRPAVAVVVTAVLFGLFHLSVYRLFGTAALGLVMGALVVRSGSIGPAMVFHALNNGLALALLPMDASAAEQEAILHRVVPWAALAFAAGGALLWWTPRRRSAD